MLTASSSHLPNLFPSKDSTNASNELYIIFDNSFSMQAKGQKELLKRAVQELLEDTLKTLCFSCLLILKAIGTPT
jgi:Mg-chelatase subunit ChlD